MISSSVDQSRIRSLSQRAWKPVNIDVSPVTVDEIPDLHAFVKSALGPGIASVKTVRSVHSRQNFSLWKVLDAGKSWSGAYAFLYLNQSGLEAVRTGQFNSSDPDMTHLATDPQDVVGIFAWCLVLRGKSKAALIKAAKWLDLCGWTDCPIFTNPVTPRGTKLARKLGFRPVDESGASNVHVA